jgi:cytosine/uracil/thiamine/allantoin permease
MNRALAIEWNAGLGFAWSFYYGQWSRIAKSETAAYHGPYWGWGPIMCIAVIFASFTALVTGELDPTAWMIAVGGPVWGLLGLILMAVANITSVTLLVYTQCIPVKYTWPKLKWGWVVMTAAPAIILFQSGVFYGYNIFLTLIGIIWTINASLLLADFFVVRKGKFDLKQLYHRGPKYTYFHGWNIPALLMYPVGFVFYFAIFDPILAVEGPITGIFPYTTALIPAFAITFVLYSIIGKALYGKQS